MIDLYRITNPLRLARGTHVEGSGKGCAMNVVSYVNGDTKITDYPDCSARPLALLVQEVNDMLAGPDGYLSPEKSVVVLDLGFATMGTADVPNSVVYAWLAELLDSPEWGVSQFVSGEVLLTTIATADLLRKSSNGAQVSVAEWGAACTNAYVDYYAAKANAVDFVLAAAYANAVYTKAASHANAVNAVNAVDYFNSAYAAAACAADARVMHARQAIAAWRRLAGLDEVVVDVQEVNSALEKLSA